MSLAYGMVETRGLVAALEAADAMLKASDVRLVARTRVDPALVTVQVEGETAAVRAAVDAGRAAAERVGQVVAAHVIPRPADGVLAIMSAQPKKKVPARPAPGGPDGGVDGGDLAARSVQELRALARALPGGGGRAVARATKQELLALLGAA